MKLQVIEELVKEIYGEFFNDLEGLQIYGENQGKIFEISFQDEDFEQRYLLDLKRRKLYNSSIGVEAISRNQDFGRKLVEASEELCRALEIDIIIINNNKNCSFWDHMGYIPASEGQIDYWSGTCEIDDFCDCMFKEL